MGPNGPTTPAGQRNETADGAPAPRGDVGDVEGIDAGPVTEWFCTTIDGVSPPLRFRLIAGGRSNLTFRVDDAGGRTFALRRPPVSHVLPTAHDMVREHRLMTSLGPTDVPVPRTHGLCVDDAVNGAPFFVMEFVDGHILRDAGTAEAAFDESTRRHIGDHMADTLAALHAVDVEAVGLGDLGRHTGYVERQLKRWSEQYSKMAGDGGGHGGLVEEVAAALGARVPEPQGVAIVHGDFRLDNVILDGGGRVRAVLDWEICTLGDPLADVGTLMCYWTEPADDAPALLIAPTTAPGFAGRRAVLDRYAERSGLDVSDISFYTAFGYWKLACILQGVYARYVAGAGAGDTGSVDEFPRQVGKLAELAARELARS